MAFVKQLDELGLGVQAAAWLFFYGLNDWRYYVATPLVDTMGRKRVYSLLADALDVVGTPDGMTVFDIHLESPDGALFRLLNSAVRIDNAVADLQNCTLDGVRIDGVFYRVNRDAPAPAMNYPKKAAATFKRNVEQILERS